MSATIYDLPPPSLSRLLAAQELAGALSARGIADAAGKLRGQVPDADLILAACRRFCAVSTPGGLLELLDELDNLLVD